MKSLTTLIDMKQRALDEKRRVLVQLEEERDRIHLDQEKLMQELARESSLASKQPELARYFGEFSQANEKQQAECEEKQETIQKLIDAQRDQITAAFADLKQLEIAKEQREQEAKAKADRTETAQLDEIALQQYLREE
jgi:hypothetical protein